MKGFRFRLGPVLAIRQHREELLQGRFAESQRALESEVARLQGVETEMADGARSLAQRQQPGPLDLSLLSTGNSHMASLEHLLEIQGKRVDEQTTRAAESRSELLRASQERRTLEKLREDLLFSYVRDISSRQQKVADEMAVVQHIQRSEPCSTDS